MSVNGGDDRVAEAFARAINQVFGCGLTLSAIVGLPEVNDELARRLGGAIEELDVAVDAIRHAALVAHDDRLVERPPQRATLGVEPDATARGCSARAAEGRRLRRLADDGVFAYATGGHDFYRASDDILWAHESDDLLLSARSGTPFAHRVGTVFFDMQSDLPLFHEQDTGSSPTRSRDMSCGETLGEPMSAERGTAHGLVAVIAERA